MDFIEKQINKLLKKAVKRKLNRKEKRLISTLTFLIRLLILAMPLYVILIYNISLLPIQRAVSVQVEDILKTMGYNIERENVTIQVNKISGSRFTFIISEDCTGWKSMLFLFALIFAIPNVAFIKRLYGLLFGLPMVWLGNLLRIVIVVFVEGIFGYSAAMIIHDYLWQAGLIALVLSLWLIWMKMFKVF